MFFDKFLTKIFGTSNERAIKKLTPFVALISALEPEIEQLTDEQLRDKTVEFRAGVANQLLGVLLPAWGMNEGAGFGQLIMWRG